MFKFMYDYYSLCIKCFLASTQTGSPMKVYIAFVLFVILVSGNTARAANHDHHNHNHNHDMDDSDIVEGSGAEGPDVSVDEGQKTELHEDESVEEESIEYSEEDFLIDDPQPEDMRDIVTIRVNKTEELKPTIVKIDEDSLPEETVVELQNDGK